MSAGLHRNAPRRIARARWSVLKGMVAMPLVFVLASGVAEAYWSAGSGTGGNGASAAATVNQGATPTASAAGQAVTVSWAARTLSNGNAVAGYIVKRYDVGTLTLQIILSACTGTVTATTCTESSVPTGHWVYSVTPVFATNWRGAESLKSNAVTIDATPPVNSISLSGVSGNAVKSGNTIYYRGVASGSFTLANAVSDSGSGPASSTAETLTGTATGWTHTQSTVSTPAGGPYVSTAFSWTAGTTSSPTEVVTGRDVAGNTAATTLSFVNDSTAPTAGTITYTDGYQPGRSVAVTFTAGTDSGSGLATGQLQRSFAPLTGGSCGSYNSFANLGPANPTSAYTDSQVTNGICYQYRYVVTDKVGNQNIATSTNVARVDYAGAVNTTAGLLSQWRLGESAATLTSSDSFTGTARSLLTSRIGEIGATWAYQGGSADTEQISSENRARRDGTGYSINYTTVTPLSPDYSVEADLFVKSNLAGDMAGVIGRLDTGTNSFYMARWEQGDTSWNLVKYNNGKGAYMNWVSGQPALTVGQTYRIRLNMIGTAVKLYVNGVLTVSATDTTVTAAGKAGIMDGEPAGTATKSDTTGLHFDNFQVTPSTYPRAADSKGSNTGDYVNGVTLGAAGALAGDANTAAQFDGVNDYVQAVGTTGIPVGASLRSVEMWFKTTSVARQVLFNYGTRANAQDFGLWLNAGGASMTAWGFGAGNDKTFTLASAVNDGTWHQVVKTYDGTTITLYIDGVALPSQTATRGTVMDSYGFGIGAVISTGDANSGGYFTGSLDEVSLYTTVLNQTTVTNHYQLGTSPPTDVTGPTGGSVDAGGLIGTGSRYTTSTVLSLNLNKGTDPSGVAATGAQLLRASATLTSAGGTANGACGSFGAYTLVTGGTDPVSPKSDTVTDQACYSYRYVVADTLGNPTTYTSPSIKVDTTAPDPPPLTFSAFANTYWSGAGSSVYYRSAAGTGTFTTTASATDTASGIAGYAFPALGANWTSTPGSLGVNTYSWTGAPAAPGTTFVTATNNATGTSAGAPFTLTADNTAPTAGTVTYLNGTTTSTSVSVSFTTGTDGGSGIGTRLLQRASATLTGSTCGAFGAFSTLTNGTNPTSPLVNTVNRGTCYTYRYVVPDNVGNQDIATSPSVVKVSLTYLDTVNGTAGLVNYWRLGETTTSSDSFTGTPGVTLQSHTGEVGATWTKHPISGTTDVVITAGGRIRKDGATWGALYHSSAVPASADYTVEADVYVASSLTGDLVGIAGRLDPANANGTFYAATYDQSSGLWTLISVLNGATAMLGQTTAQVLTVGTTYRLALDMTGSTIRLLVNGVQQVSVVDTTITAAGRGGVAMGFGSATTTVTDNTGMHLDNFTVTPPLADTKGTNNGVYLNGPTLGVPGAIVGDPNTAARFDGVNDFGSVARQISDNFSIEFWFKSTQGIGTGTAWWQGAGLVDADVSGTNNDFGVSLRSDGKVVAGVGNPDVSIVSSSGGYNNGGWHHVVFTRTMATGALQLYVDGVLAGSATGNTASLTSPVNINLGRIQSGSDYFSGSLDEVAAYNTVLSGSTVTSHYNAGQ
ncbi:MAG: LamG-like jellyroll fold domain-containing protein [Dermatophilaceae bacterium]